MRVLNLFYLAVVSVGIGLFFLLISPPREELAIFGFAESNEGEINYPAPVAVLQLLVRPGQAVDSGQVLLHLVRRNPRETLADEELRIGELRAEAGARRDRQRQQLAVRQTSYQNELGQISEQIDRLDAEVAFRNSLSKGLTTVRSDSADYQPLRDKLAGLAGERERVTQRWRADSLRIARDAQLGEIPYRARIERLRAEAEFDQAREQTEIFLTAPADGLIGAINCREGEYKNAYANLMTFYEPHSELIRGYLYEELTVDVDTGALFEAVSLKDASIRYPGRVVGLGSRIVEIPVRLRKYPEVASYGREVTVAIPTDNRFLQAEKVSLRYVEDGK